MFFRLLACFAAILSFLSCAKEQKTKPIGNQLSGVFDLEYSKLKNRFYVLNSSFDGEFKSGSLGLYAPKPNQNRPQDLEFIRAFDIPRLGLELALSADATLAAVSFSGENPVVKVYDTTHEGELRFLWDLSFDSRDVRQLKFFKPKASSSWYLAASIDSRQSFAQTRVWKMPEALSQSAQPNVVLTYPADVTKPEDYGFRLGYNSPVFLESQQLLILFPRAGENVPNVPSALDFMQKKSAAQAELRTVSLGLISFETGMVGASYFVPLAYNNDGKSYVPQEPNDSSSNRSFVFRNSISNAFSLPESCAGSLASSVFITENRYVDSRNQSDVFQISGFEDLYAQLKNQSQTELFDQTLLLKVTAFSRLSNQNPLFDAVSNEITDFDVLYSSDSKSCFPVWLREELGRNNAGRELIHVQYAKPSSDDGRFEVKTQMLPYRGARRFAVGNIDFLSAGYFNTTLDFAKGFFE